MNTATPLHWASAERSHVGMVRKVNEDDALALPERGLWAVADGMGGHEAGDLASRLIIDTLRAMPPSTDWQAFLAATQACLHQANDELRQESAQRYHNRTIGSTVVVLLADKEQGACFWVGDSRLYRLREGQLQPLTRDHSHVQELVDQGLISAEEAHEHPLGNVITRAVGSTDELEIDYNEFALQANDVYLLCSDGLNKVVSDMEIACLLAQNDPQEIADSLIQLALMRGATDNVTVVVVMVKAVQPH